MEFLVYHRHEMPNSPTTCSFSPQQEKNVFLNLSAAVPTLVLGYCYLKSSTKLSHMISGDFHGFGKKKKKSPLEIQHPHEHMHTHTINK